MDALLQSRLRRGTHEIGKIGLRLDVGEIEPGAEVFPRAGQDQGSRAVDARLVHGSSQRLDERCVQRIGFLRPVQREASDLVRALDEQWRHRV